MRRDDPAQEHLELGARERQIMEAVYRLGRASVAEVLEQLPDDPSYSTVRTMLNKLEAKGRLAHAEEEGRYVYYPRVPREQAERSTLRRIVHGLFDGSVERAMTAIIETEGADLDDEQLERVARRIEALRRERL